MIRNNYKQIINYKNVITVIIGRYTFFSLMELCDFEFARFGVLAIIRILFCCKNKKKEFISNTYTAF